MPRNWPRLSNRSIVAARDDRSADGVRRVGARPTLAMMPRAPRAPGPARFSPMHSQPTERGTLRADPLVAIPARDTETEFRVFDRGSRFLELLEGMDIDVRGKRVVDLGTGYGFLALAAARAAASSVTAVDVDADRLAQVKRRAETEGLAVTTVQANLLDPTANLPGSDLAFLIGVVEYAGLWDTTAPIKELQRRVFTTAYNALEPGGQLIFGSKNRLWPALAVRDVHTRLPLVNVLPRGLADKLSQRVRGVPYRHHIHSPRAWSGLVSAAGFRKVEVFFPFFSYQLPVLIEQRPSFASMRRLARMHKGAEEEEAAFGRRWLVKSLVMATAGTLRVPLSHSIHIRATK
jgi:SAM-dependent methyltransferase